MQNMPPLIGLAHGSRDPRAARMIGEVMRAVQALRPGLVAVPAFLDLSEPDLTTAVAALRDDQSIAEAIVLPLLFSEAYHATVDAPTAVRDAQEATGVSLRLGGILGMGEDVLLALEDSAAAAHIASHEAILLLAVGSSSDDGERRGARTGRPLEPAPARAGVGRVRHHRGAAGGRLSRAGNAQRRRIGVVPLFLAPGCCWTPPRGRPWTSTPRSPSRWVPRWPAWCCVATTRR